MEQGPSSKEGNNPILVYVLRPVQYINRSPTRFANGPLLYTCVSFILIGHRLSPTVNLTYLLILRMLLKIASLINFLNTFHGAQL